MAFIMKKKQHRDVGRLTPVLVFSMLMSLLSLGCQSF